MPEYMTKDDYQRYLALDHEFAKCLVMCAEEISMLARGRMPIGDFDGDTDIYEEGRYLVRFEDWSGCEVDYDSVYVPAMYIYDETQRAEHRKYVAQMRKDEEIERVRREKEREAKTKTYRVVGDERAEYERLKTIYGDE